MKRAPDSRKAAKGRAAPPRPQSVPAGVVGMGLMGRSIATCLLAAGHPELVKKRWMERLLDRQNPDGSWNYCWYGWCRGIFEFSLTQEDQEHTTVQAAWALYQLKYRYPDWIDQNFK